jgi:hypothetical protein
MQALLHNGAYQIEDEIWVTSDTERAYWGGGWTAWKNDAMWL